MSTYDEMWAERRKNADRSFWVMVLLFLAFFAAIAAGVWYWTGRQQAVYAQQGVEMSRFDILIGVRPAGTPAKR